LYLKSGVAVQEGGKAAPWESPEVPWKFVLGPDRMRRKHQGAPNPQHLIDFKNDFPWEQQMFEYRESNHNVKTPMLEIVTKLVSIADNIAPVPFK